MEKITFFVICALAVFEGYVADSQVNLSTNPASTQTDELSLTDRAELQIINLCTEVPSYYDGLMEVYSNLQPGSDAGLQKIKEIESKLQSATNELKQYVVEYDESNLTTDPDAGKVQQLMSSAVDGLMQSVSKLNAEMGQTMQSGENSAERMKEIMRPAMVKFDESCLLQTKDILKNVLESYESTLIP